MSKKHKKEDNTSFSSTFKSFFKKKKSPSSASSSSTSLATPKDTSVVPISSPSFTVRFFKQDPTLPQDNDLRDHETINNAQELAYCLQQRDLTAQIIYEVAQIIDVWRWGSRG